MVYRKTPRQIEDQYHHCIQDGKTAQECVALIEPEINLYADPEGVKKTIKHYREQRKKYEESRRNGLESLDQLKQGLRK